MAVIYKNLIIEGYRTFKSVPNVIKPKVKEVLEQLGLPELAKEEQHTGTEYLVLLKSGTGYN